MKFKFKPGKKDQVIDLGLNTGIPGKNQRILNKDGSFNIERRGIPFLSSFSFYHYLISVSWLKFCLIILSSFVIVNVLFAFLYMLGGEGNFEGIVATNEFERFLNEFFFSTQTFTTVGYGRINPVGIYSNIISSVESLSGLLSLALATGLLYGRFSKPVARIIYSRNALIAPFNDINALQFRIANQRSDHQMVDVEIDLILSVIENNRRRFYNLELEYRKITFFNSSWTVNHPIGEQSPLWGLTENNLKESEAEFLIMLKGFDNTFAQNVHSRFSYTYDEIIWGAEFVKIFGANESGQPMIELDKIGDYRISELNKSG